MPVSKLYPDKTVSSGQAEPEMKRHRSCPKDLNLSQPVRKRYRLVNEISTNMHSYRPQLWGGLRIVSPNFLPTLPAQHLRRDESNDELPPKMSKDHGVLRVVNTPTNGARTNVTPVLAVKVPMQAPNNGVLPTSVDQATIYGSESAPSTESQLPSDLLLLTDVSQGTKSYQSRSQLPPKHYECETTSDADEPAPPASTEDYRARYPSEDYAGFEVFGPQIQKLVMEGLWTNRPSSDFKITKLAGGAFNRVVEVQVKPPAPIVRSRSTKLKRRLTKLRGKVPKGELDRYDKFFTTYDSGNYILRIPRLYQSRHATFNFEADYIMHDFVADLGVSCPRIITYQGQDNGIVPFPYLLQEKIAGKQLWYLWPQMTHAQHLQIARQIGDICRKMTSERYPVYGRLAALGKPYRAQDGSITRDKTYLEPQWLNERGSSRRHGPGKILQCGIYNHFEPRAAEIFKVSTSKLCDIVRKLDGLCAFGSSESWYFTHGDFYPRNIMADIDAEGNARITSVLDWDMASFQPQVVACKPPACLWCWRFYRDHRGDEDNLDIIASMDPSNDMDVEIKKAFDEAVGDMYCKIAHHPYAYTARKLALWAWKGEDTWMAHTWRPWISWWLNNWEDFEDKIRTKGFPQTNGKIRNPIYFS